MQLADFKTLLVEVDHRILNEAKGICVSIYTKYPKKKNDPPRKYWNDFKPLFTELCAPS